MEFEIINNKKVVNGKIDLLSNYFQIDYDKVIIQDWVIIDESTTMALDLICTAAYSNPEFLDLVLKFNRLSNALELGVGQIIALPDITSLIANSRYVDLSNSTPTGILTISKKQNITALTNPTSKPKPASNFIKLNGNYVF